MKITYTGPFAEITLIDRKRGKEYPCKRGESIDVPEELGREQIKLDDWKTTGKEGK